MNMFINSSVSVSVFIIFQKFWKFHTLAANDGWPRPSKWFSNGVMVRWDNPKMTSISSSASYSKCATIYSASHKLSIIFFHWLLYCALVLLGFRGSVRCCCRCCCRLSIQTNLLILILSHGMIEASVRCAWARVRVRRSFIMLLNGWHHFLCLFLLNFDHVFYVNACWLFVVAEFCLWLILCHDYQTCQIFLSYFFLFLRILSITTTNPHSSSKLISLSSNHCMVSQTFFSVFSRFLN